MNKTIMFKDLQELECLAAQRKEEIRSSADAVNVGGNTYYVSAEGCDEYDGRSPERAWKTLAKVSSAKLCEGDGVLFRRGDVFRGGVIAQAGVTYAAYGEGEKPRLYGGDRDLADHTLWAEHDPKNHIWRLTMPILDVGTLVFDEGGTWSRKLIPSYIGGRFVCRDAEERPFEMSREMTDDLDLYWHFDTLMTTRPSKGADFPVPQVDENSYGTLYLRCDRGNPGEVFRQIEALPRRCMFKIGDRANIHIDNLCIKYVGHHAISAGGHVIGLRVTHCEIGWIGGTIQHYFGTDPNYPQGGRGTVTRFGNGVEIYGGCENYEVSDCYIYQCYDAGITHQITTGGRTVTMCGIRYLNNLVERCVYSIEYFLDMNGGDTNSCMQDIVMRGNLLRLAGYGWGQQRHNIDTPAHIKGWSYVNRARDYHIHDNIFDRSAYRMLHLVAEVNESCPEMRKNIYVQHRGGMLGQYGGNADGEPPILFFDENAADSIRRIFKDEDAVLYFLEE
ncbi:MAG: hypothetical protein IJW40_02280 [Clostridia bacterium]|nr:hypothetical protein [Clostridia bacterium]